jgi:hypothetical protein
MNDKIKNRILKVYVNLMGSFFNHWKKNIFDTTTIKKMKMVQEMQSMNLQMTNEALEQEKVIR